MKKIILLTTVFTILSMACEDTNNTHYDDNDDIIECRTEIAKHENGRIRRNQDGSPIKVKVCRTKLEWKRLKPKGCQKSSIW